MIPVHELDQMLAKLEEQHDRLKRWKFTEAASVIAEAIQMLRRERGEQQQA